MNKFVILAIIILMIPISFGEELCNIEEEDCNAALLNATEGADQPAISHNPDAICIMYFYGTECPKCAQTTPYIESLEAKYGDKIAVTKYEIYHNVKNYQIYNNLCAVQNVEMGQRKIPLVAIGNEYYIGVSKIKDNLELKINEMLKSGERICPLGGEMSCHYIKGHESEDTDHFILNFKDGITIPLVIGAGLIDGINPCAFAVLIFLLAFLMEVSSNKRRMVKAGIAYVVSVYITYFVAGLGLLTFIQVTGASSVIVKIAAAIAIITGLINIKDYFWYGKGISLKIPESKKGIIEGLVKKANLPAAFILGALVSMFELPCTGGVYLAIVAMLSSTVTKAKAIYYLLAYNIMFVLPLIIIIIAVTKGMKAEHIENWRKSQRNVMKLVLGLLLLLLGIVMLLGWL